MEAEPEKINYEELLWNFFSIAWRRKYWVMLPTLLGVLASVALFFVLPKVYQSNTLILVEAQKVPQSVVQSALTGTAQDRLSTIKQQVLSRSYLSKIIDKFSLYQAEDPKKEMNQQKKIAQMRKNIALSTRGRRRLESFSISFSGEDPETVMNVTNELASLVLEENLKIREQFVEGAIDFLDSELGRNKALLERRETELREYKMRYIGELPGQIDSNLRALDRFQSHLDAIQLTKNGIKDRIIDLENTLKNTRKNISLAIQGDGSSDMPFDSISALDMQLKQRRQRLSTLLLEYNESYPDVIALRREIKKIEGQQGFLGKAHLPDGEAAPSRKVDRINLENLEPIVSIKRQIRVAMRELKEIETRKAETVEQIADYEKRVENTPRRETELIVLQRDYDSIARSYQDLLSKKLSAQVSRNLEKRQKGEQFRVIDPANFPIEPIKPNKITLFLLGIALGLGSGVGLAFVKEQLDNTIRKASEVEGITNTYILAEIPDFELEVQNQKKRKKEKVVNIKRFSGRTRRIQQGGRIR